MNESGHEDVFSFHGHRKPLEMFILEHFLFSEPVPASLENAQYLLSLEAACHGR
jgi:hypothetical protein